MAFSPETYALLRKQVRAAETAAQLADGIYPGSDLTAEFAAEIEGYSDEWAWIKARITAGDFSGIHVGDYIPVTANGNDYNARIIGINTYKGYGEPEVGNHIDWCFDELWTTRHSINLANYNNGMIPIESVTTDGTATEFTLTKEMDSVAKIEQDGAELTGYTYDAETFKIAFTEAPAAGTITVTGTGTEHPWLACDLYKWLNSLAGQVPNGTGLNPAVKHVDYTAGGVFYYLPDKLKAVIIEKRVMLPKRFSTSAIQTSDTGWGWADMGKLWLPSEIEVYGTSTFGGTGYSTGGFVQYPFFAGKMTRVKKRNGSRASWWILNPYYNNATYWCYIASQGRPGFDAYTTANSPSVAVFFRT